MSAKTGIFHHPIFAHMVRVRLADRLVSELGYDRPSALAAVAGLDDAAIQESAAHLHAAEPKAGAGGIIAAILAFLTSPAFGQLIALLLSLFGGAATTAPTETVIP